MPPREPKKKRAEPATDRSTRKTSKTAVRPKLKKQTGSTAVTEFASVFTALKKVMATHASELHVANDDPHKYYVVTRSLSWKGGPMLFGAVIWGKAYVSYHLFPLYIRPELAKNLSKELKGRMQGKTCFNFRNHDDALYAELSELTNTGLEHYRAKKLL